MIIFFVNAAGRVYGADLSALCERQGALIPPFVTQLMGYIEEECVKFNVKGIYRMSGNKKQIAKLRAEIQAGTHIIYVYIVSCIMCNINNIVFQYLEFFLL